MSTALNFKRVNTIPASGSYEPGCVYFETSTNLVYVAKTTTNITCYSGVRNISWNATTNELTFVNPAGTSVTVDFSEVVTEDKFTALLTAVGLVKKGDGYAFDATSDGIPGTNYLANASSNTVKGALEVLDDKLHSVEGQSGVISIGGANGVITLKTDNTSTGTINLSMDGSTLSASIVNASSAAYKTVEYFVGTTSDTSADDTIKGAKAYTTEVLGVSGDASTANTVHGAINKAEAVKTELLGTVGDASNVKTIEGLTTKINDTSTNATLHLYSGDSGTTVATHVKADGQTYRLVQGANATAQTIATFNIERDTFVQDASVVYFATAEAAQAATHITDASAGHYIHMVVKTSPDTSGGGTTEKDIWIPAESLVDSYTADNTGKNVTVTVNNTANTISAEVATSDGTHLVQHNNTEVTLATIAGQTVKAKIASLENTADNTAGGVKITETVTSGNAELSARIVDGAVTTAKIVDGNVTEAKLSSDVSTKLNGAVQTVTGETAISNPNDDYINVKVSATKTGTDVSLGTTYSLVTHDVSTAAANANGLTTAYDVQDYVKTYVSEQLVWAQFD